MSIYPFLTYSVFAADALCQAVTLTFDLLTLKVCGTSFCRLARKRGNYDALQLVAARRHSNPCPCHVRSRSTHLCRLIAYLLLLRYVRL